MFFYLLFILWLSFLNQEDDQWVAEQERDRVNTSQKLKNTADNLLNRMDEIGMQALLEDDFEDGTSAGRAKDRVSATELLNALSEK